MTLLRGLAARDATADRAGVGASGLRYPPPSQSSSGVAAAGVCGSRMDALLAAAAAEPGSSLLARRCG